MGHPKSHPAHCVVWTAPSAPLPDALDRVLRARSVAPVHARSAHAALAELCLAQHAGRRSALILADPPDPARLLAAVERFAPGAVVWIFQPGANPPLRPVVQNPKAPARSGPTTAQGPVPPGVESRNGRHHPPPRHEPETGPAPTPEPPPTPMRPVRETTLKPAHPPADPTRNDRPISARDILDDDELEMLLAAGPAKEDDPR